MLRERERERGGGGRAGGREASEYSPSQSVASPSHQGVGWRWWWWCFCDCAKITFPPLLDNSTPSLLLNSSCAPPLYWFCYIPVPTLSLHPLSTIGPSSLTLRHPPASLAPLICTLSRETGTSGRDTRIYVYLCVCVGLCNHVYVSPGVCSLNQVLCTLFTTATSVYTRVLHVYPGMRTVVNCHVVCT